MSSYAERVRSTTYGFGHDSGQSKHGRHKARAPGKRPLNAQGTRGRSTTPSQRVPVADTNTAADWTADTMTAAALLGTPDDRKDVGSTDDHDTWVRDMDIASGTAPVPTEPDDMRAFVEHHIVTEGRFWGPMQVRLALRADGVTDQQRLCAEQQIQRVLAEADALASQFKNTAMNAAWTLLDQSSRQIGSVLAGYGLSLNIDDLVLQLATDDADVDDIARRVLARSKGDVGRESGTYENQAKQRARLSQIAQVLTAKQQHLRSLYAERTSLMQERDEARPIAIDPAREHASHHQAKDKLGDSRILDLVTPDGLASQSPEFAGLMQRARQPAASCVGGVGGDPAKLAHISLWLQATDADIKRAQIDYKTHWLEAERAHPILALYRARPGRDVDLGALTVDSENDDQLMQNVLEDVLPKLANIGKAGHWLKTGHLNPLELPPVVKLARQRMSIAPGTIRAKVADELVEDADDGNWKQWAIAAVTLGMAILSVAPTGGGSAVLLAELGGLALDAYLAMETFTDFTVDKAAADTSIDPSLALANEEPSLTWLAVELVAAGLGAGFAVKTFRDAARLHRRVAAGDSAQAAVRELNKLGEQHGLGKLGSRIVDRAEGRTKNAQRGARPKPNGKRVREHASDDIDGLARQLGTGVEIDSSLGSGVRVDRFVHADGDVWVIGLRVGPDATTDDVLAHGKTIALMRRYNGVLGYLRATLSRGLGKSVHKAGSPQEIASLEAEKLRRLIHERQKALTTETMDDAAVGLNQEIAFLHEQLVEWEARLLSKQPERVVAGFGDIGSPNLLKKLSKEQRKALRQEATTIKNQLRQEIFEQSDLNKPGRSGGAVGAQLNVRLGNRLQQHANTIKTTNPALAATLKKEGQRLIKTGKSGKHK